MNAIRGRLMLLDANIIVHLLRRKSTGVYIEQTLSLADITEPPILSSVVEAEILGLARHRKWGEKRIEKLMTLLCRLVRVDAGHPDVIHAYIDLYCEARRKGRYKQFRQNDLWIAATARAAGAVVYTCNGKDFDWIDPNYVEVVSIYIK